MTPSARAVARFPSAHAVAAGAVAAASSLGGALAGPWSPIVDAGGALTVAAIAAHAVARAAGDREPLFVAIARAARTARRRTLLARLMVMSSGASRRSDWWLLGGEIAREGGRRIVKAGVETTLHAVALPIGACTDAIAAARAAVESALFVGDLETAARAFASS